MPEFIANCLQIVHKSGALVRSHSTVWRYPQAMLGLNKKALYQMAQRSNDDESLPGPITFKTKAAGQQIHLRPVNGNSSLPDGRFVSKLDPSGRGRAPAKDKIQVSAPVENPELVKKLSVSKNDVRAALGHGTLGLLANAYMEQSRMTAKEITSVQESFSGFRGF